MGTAVSVYVIYMRPSMQHITLPPSALLPPSSAVGKAVGCSTVTDCPTELGQVAARTSCEHAGLGGKRPPAPFGPAAASVLYSQRAARARASRLVLQNNSLVLVCRG